VHNHIHNDGNGGNNTNSDADNSDADNSGDTQAFAGCERSRSITRGIQ
jgi:hypothetical protein